jgi:hypothetical protein
MSDSNAFALVGILLPFGLALERSTDRGGRFNEPPVDDISRRTRTAVTSVDQLNDAGGSKEAKRSEFEQSFGFLDLAVLEPKSISLQSAEYLLDAPAQPLWSRPARFQSLLGDLAAQV